MKKIVLTFTALLMIYQSYAVGINEPTFDHSTWHKLLQKHVSNDGNVNYEGFMKDREFLKQYLSELSVQTPKANWDRDAKMAYWINAYNAFTVDLILENYPVKSIMDINEGKAWDLKFIKLGGTEYSLNNIEHDILRAKFKDARIHFAVNCASISCPKLHNAAFSEADLERQLETLVRAFLNDESKNKISAEKIEISQLFKWYKSDFEKFGNIIDYINAYHNPDANADAKIYYKDYNWNLNK